MGVVRAIAEHDTLLAMAGRLRRVVAGQLTPDHAYALLGEFSSRVAEHRAEEVQTLYAPLIAYAEARSDEFGSMLWGMLTNATTDWSCYVDGWTPDRMEADWSTFGVETVRVLNRGRARLCLENELLYPLAMREGIVIR